MFKGKSVLTKEWVSGFLVVEPKTRLLPETPYIIANGEIRISDYGLTAAEGIHAVLPETLSQSTNRDDIENKTIFQNDVVEFSYISSKKAFKLVGVVVLNEYSSFVVVDIAGREYNLSEVITPKIVGNIIDTPNLLKTIWNQTCAKCLTGHCDANGEDIVLGDIVQYTAEHSGGDIRTENATVIFNGSGFFLRDRLGWLYLMEAFPDKVVIGNVFKKKRRSKNAGNRKKA